MNSKFSHFSQFQIPSLLAYLNFKIWNWILSLYHFKSYNIFPHFIFQTHSLSCIIFQIQFSLSLVYIVFSYLHFFHLHHISNLSYFFSFFRNMVHRLKGRTQVKFFFFILLICVLHFSSTNFIFFSFFIVGTSNIVIEDEKITLVWKNTINKIKKELLLYYKKTIFLWWRITKKNHFTQDFHHLQLQYSNH
jgi:hypothetical protein